MIEEKSEISVSGKSDEYVEEKFNNLCMNLVAIQIYYTQMMFKKAMFADDEEEYEEDSIDDFFEEIGYGADLGASGEEVNIQVMKDSLKLVEKYDFSLPKLYEKLDPESFKAYAALAENEDKDLVNLITKVKQIEKRSLEDGSAMVTSSAFFDACEEGNAAIVGNYLKQDNGDVNCCKESEGSTGLIIASASGNDNIVKLLLEQDNIDVNKGDSRHCTALIRAAEGGYKDIVKLLLGIDNTSINSKDKYGKDALNYAIENRRTDIALLLLDCPKLEITDSFDKLFSIIFNGDLSILKKFIQREDLDINMCDEAKYAHSNNILMRIIESENKSEKTLESVKFILENCKDFDVNYINKENKSALFLAAENGMLEILKLLLAHPDIDVNMITEDDFFSRKRTVLNACMISCSRDIGLDKIFETIISCPKFKLNHNNAANESPDYNFFSTENPLEFIKIFLKHRPEDFNSLKIEGEPVLYKAFSYRAKDVIEFLLDDPRADIFIKGKEYGNILEASMYFLENDTEFIARIYKKFINKNDIIKDIGTDILILAIEKEDSKLLNLVLENPDIDINSKNRKGNTPLISAVKKGNQEVLDILLTCPGIDINIRGENNLTALDNCVYTPYRNRDTYEPVFYKNYMDSFKKLLSRPEIKIDDIEFEHPIFYAARFGLQECVKMLLEKGTDINIISRDGGCSLAHESDAEVLSFLLGRDGININIKDSKFQLTPLQDALGCEQLKKAELLLSRYDIDLNCKDNNSKNLLYYFINYRSRGSSVNGLSYVLSSELPKSIFLKLLKHKNFNLIKGDALTKLIHVVGNNDLETAKELLTPEALEMYNSIPEANDNTDEKLQGSREVKEEYTEEEQINPTKEQKRWALAACAVLTIYNNQDTNMLGGCDPTPQNIEAWTESLKEKWGIENRENLLKFLNWLKTEGLRTDYSKLGEMLSKMDPSEIEEFKKQCGENSEKLNKIQVCSSSYKFFGPEKSLLGWDGIIYISLCGWGYIAGYLTEDEAWNKIMPMARNLQKTFAQWYELTLNYTLGRQYWSPSEAKKTIKHIQEIFTNISSDPKNLWNELPWDLNLG